MANEMDGVGGFLQGIAGGIRQGGQNYMQASQLAKQQDALDFEKVMKQAEIYTKMMGVKHPAIRQMGLKGYSTLLQNPDVASKLGMGHMQIPDNLEWKDELSPLQQEMIALFKARRDGTLGNEQFMTAVSDTLMRGANLFEPEQAKNYTDMANNVINTSNKAQDMRLKSAEEDRKTEQDTRQGYGRQTLAALTGQITAEELDQIVQGPNITLRKYLEANLAEQSPELFKEYQASTNKATKPDTSIMNDKRYMDIQSALSLKQPVSQEDLAWVKAYEKQKTLSANAYGASRLNVTMSAPVAVYDENEGTYKYVSRSDALKSDGRFKPQAGSTKILNQNMLIEDISGSIRLTKEALAKMPDFNAKQAAQIAMLLKHTDPRGALGSFIQSGVGQTLTPEQQDYIINLLQLKEQAMSMRSILGAGQGSDMMREAIDRTTPSASTPNKQYALKQLDAFEKTLSRVRTYVPQIKPARSEDEQKTPAATPKPTTIKIGGYNVRVK